MTTTPQALADGLELRVARPEDVEDIVALQVAAFGSSDEVNVRSFLVGPGASITNWSVVTDGSVIVSASALLDVPVRLDGLRLPASQIEYVATDPAYQRRGLVRAQIDRHHERSAARGDVLQFIGGIPWFYRRFGYGYGVSHPEMFRLDRDEVVGRLAPGADVVVRNATEADLPALEALEAQRPTAGVTAARDETWWRRELAVAEGSAVDMVVVERGDSIVAWASYYISHDEHRVYLQPTRTPDDATTDALLAHGLVVAGPDLAFVATDAPDPAMAARFRALGTHLPYGQGVYVRIPDPVALLDALTPVLSRRLAVSSFAGATGEVAISLYASGLAIAYDTGTVTGVRAIPPVEDPWDEGGCGVAPDWFPASVLGRWGAAELAERIDDVFLGHDAELLEVLFPRLDSDIVADF